MKSHDDTLFKTLQILGWIGIAATALAFLLWIFGTLLIFVYIIMKG